jgi:hypothetical protein
MQIFLSPEFWSDQIAHVFKAWAILLALGLVFCLVLAKTKMAMRKLKAYADAMESRLQMARDLNSGETNRLAELRAEIDGLRRLKSKPRIEAALKAVDASAATLAIANRTTNHILTAEKLAIRDLEKKQNLRLVPLTGKGQRAGD